MNLNKMKSQTKRLLSLFLVCTLIFSNLFIVNTIANTSDEIKVWNGLEVKPTGGGDGSGSDAAILINNAEELAWVIKSGGNGKYYKLTNNIYLNDLNKINWETGESIDGYIPNQWYLGCEAKYLNSSIRYVDKSFTGTLDGDGHVVYGLYYNLTKQETNYNEWSMLGAGLIPEMGYCDIQNIGVESSYLKHYDNVSFGVLVGKTQYVGCGNISQCYVGENVTIIGYDVAGILGGGDAPGKITIDNCYSLAKMTADRYKGGILGNTWTENVFYINNCYSLDMAYGANWRYPIITNLYATVDAPGNFSKIVTIPEITGQLAVNTFKEFDFDGIWDVTEKYPCLKVFSDFEFEFPEIWGGSFVKPRKGGSGLSEENPILISHAEELAYVVKNGGNNKYYKLTSDIYLNDTKSISWYENNKNKEWISDSAFNGHLDGDGHIVYGIWYPQDCNSELVGLIPLLLDGSVKNIGVRYSYINGQNCGAIVAKTASHNSKIIDKCFSDDTVIIKGNKAAGVVGFIEDNTNSKDVTVKITNSYTKASIISLDAARCNGIIGNSWCTAYSIENCYTIGSKPYDTSHPGFRTTAVWEYAEDSTGGKLRDGVQIGDFIKNLYTNIGDADSWQVWTRNDANAFYGTNAKNSMSGLDFKNTFEVVEGSTPKLKIFETYDGKEINYDELTYSGGKGTKAEPYIIENAEQLAYLVQSTNTKGKYYEIVKDITIDEGTEWFVTEDNKTAFSGYIEGNGHYIYGLYVNDPAKEFDGNFIGVSTALFPRATVYAEIRNIHLRDSYISGPGYAAGIVGHVCDTENNEYLSIVGCSVDDTVTIKGQIVGGLVGGGPRGVEVLYSYMTANLSAMAPEEHLSAVVGDMWNTDHKVYQVYTVGYKNYRSDIYVPAYAVSLYGTVKQAQTTVVDKKNMIGENAKKSMPDLDWTYWCTVNGDTPHIKAIPEGIGINEQGKVGRVWSGKIALEFASGNGTKTDPYIIETPEQLAKAVLSQNTNSNVYYKVTADIYLNDTPNVDWYKADENKEWISDSTFKGHLDGDGHIVYGIWYPQDCNSELVGLIPLLLDGSVKNIGVRYSYINGQNCGAIVAKTASHNSKIIDKCFSDDTVIIKGNKAAGVVGFIEDNTNSKNVTVKITNSYTKAKITVSGSTGNGIIGNAWCTAYSIENCYTIGSQPYNTSHPGFRTTAVWKYADDSTGGELRDGAQIGDFIKNLYTNIGDADSWQVWTRKDADAFYGTNAKNSMSGLDFKNTFEVVEGSTPKLKIFETYDGKEINYDELTYSGGKGTKAEPYIIESAEQLAYLVQSTNTKGKYYEIVKDITIDEGTEWLVTEDNKTAFSGYIEGNGHYIYGLHVNQPAKKFDGNFIGVSTALFPRATVYAEIRNIHLRDSYISGPGYAAGIVGHVCDTENNEYLTIVGCSVDDTVTIKGQIVGGLVGGGPRGVEVVYSYTTAKLSATAPEEHLSAVVGDMWNTDHKVYQVYTVGYKNYRSDIYVPAYAVSLYGTVKQAQTTVVDKKNMIGENAKKSMPDLDWTYWCTVDGDTPHIKAIPEGIGINEQGKVGRVWSGKIALEFASGNGTKNDPYIIETPEQLAKAVLSQNTNSNVYYKVTADIYLNDTSVANWEKTAKQWFTGSNVFRGQFDGNGHIVSGLYYDTEFMRYSALFPFVGKGSRIEKLGIVNSTLKNKGSAETHTFVAPLIGWVEGTQGETTVISQCFTDTSVKVDGYFGAGLCAASYNFVVMDNCYSLASVKYVEFGGGLIGNIWTVDTLIKNSYCATENRDYIGMNLGYYNTLCEFENVYTDSQTTTNRDIKNLCLKLMQDKYALEYMKGFDFENIWSIVENGTPTLRIFKNNCVYTSRRDALKNEISFASNGGSECQPIYGYSGYTKISKDDLPVPERKGYEFVGWYHFSDLTAPFELEYFPFGDIILYAKWKEKGFKVDFEKNIDEEYDVNSYAAHYKPGYLSYNPTYVHGGMKSMLCVSSDESSVFLLSYKNTLKVSEKYEMEFWMTTDGENETGTVEFLHASNPHVYSEYSVVNTVEYTGIQKGKWQKYKLNFVASEPYILVKINGDNNLYFDDFVVSPTDGEVQKSTSVKSVDTLSKTHKLMIVIASSVLLTGALAVLVVAFKRKSKFKKQSV